MKLALIALLLAGCMTVPPTPSQCPRFDTDKLRADMEKPFRTDKEWNETIIKRMALNLDCWQGERNAK